MAINKLYISHKKYKWGGHPSCLLSEGKIETSIKDSINVDYHTSIEDLNLVNIHKVIEAAQEIYLIDINLYTIPDDQMYQVGRLYNELLRYSTKIKTKDWLDDSVLQLVNYDNTITTRETDSPVLWTAGCSITFGSGVHHSERWGSLLANKLNLSEISLSMPGTSITWSADQLIRSDMRSGDVVVWGITNIARFEYSSNWKLLSIPAVNYNSVPEKLRYWDLDYFNSNTQILISIRAIMQVINFCKKIGVKLYIANLLDQTWLPVMFRDYKNFIDLTDDLVLAEKILYLDLGSDNDHPGPKQHQHYAERIFNLIER